MMLSALHTLIAQTEAVASVYFYDGAYRVILTAGGEREATAAEVLAASKAQRITAIRAEAQQRILASYPDWRQRSAALGLYPAEYVSTMQAAIASVIAASNTGEDAVDAAADVAAVEAVTVTWPVI